jgi:hypothetical protein
MSSYTGSLAAALTKSDTIYYGPLTLPELSRTTVCLPWFSQSEIAEFLAMPTEIVLGGQFWGKRLLASTRRGLVGGFVGPTERWNTSQADFGDRMELCAKMLRAAPAGQMMAIMVSRSQARAFLKKGNCDNFELAPELRFSQLEVGPQFLFPLSSVVSPLTRQMLPTWNAVSKFMSATVEYRALERRYLGTDTTCAPSAADSTNMTLYQQAGVATLIRHARIVCCCE